jgi:pimeloyl-ACP methyl ester carboxylesterase
MLIPLGRYQISYESTGEGLPVLLMHAFPLDQRMFQPQAEALSPIARLLTFDLPGVGNSTPAPVTMEDIADLAAALLDALGIDRAVVGGVSMGGYAAFAFARRHAARLRALILANTRAVADTGEGKKGRREMAAVALDQGPAEIARRMLPRLLGETSHRERPAVVNQVRALAEAIPGQTMAWLLEALAGRPDSTDLLPRIQVPALVIAGEQDPIAPPEEASQWAARIPGARFVAIPRAGHLPNLETPATFNQAIEEFIESLAG